MRVLLGLAPLAIVLAISAMGLSAQRVLLPSEAAAVHGGCFDNKSCNTNIGNCRGYNYWDLTFCPNPTYGYCTDCENWDAPIHGCSTTATGKKCRYHPFLDIDCGCLKVGLCDGATCNLLGCDQQGAQCLDADTCETKDGACPW